MTACQSLPMAACLARHTRTLPAPTLQTVVRRLFVLAEMSVISLAILLLSNFYFQLVLVFISPCCTLNLSPCRSHSVSTQHLLKAGNSAAASGASRTSPIGCSRSSLANYTPMIPLPLQKKTKRDGKRKGWDGGMQREGGGGERSSL